MWSGGHMRGAALALERASGMGMAQRSSTRITCGPGRHLRVREKGNIRVRERRAISESEREGQYPSQREKGNIRVRGSTCSKACNSGATRHFSRDIPPPPTRKASRKVASDARPPCRGQLLSRSRRASLGGLDPHAAGCRRPGPNWPGPSGPRPGRWGVAEAATLELQVHGGRPPVSLVQDREAPCCRHARRIGQAPCLRRGAPMVAMLGAAE